MVPRQQGAMMGSTIVVLLLAHAGDAHVEQLPLVWEKLVDRSPSVRDAESVWPLRPEVMDATALGKSGHYGTPYGLDAPRQRLASPPHHHRQAFHGVADYSRCHRELFHSTTRGLMSLPYALLRNVQISRVARVQGHGVLASGREFQILCSSAEAEVEKTKPKKKKTTRKRNTTAKAKNSTAKKKASKKKKEEIVVISSDRDDEEGARTRTPTASARSARLQGRTRPKQSIQAVDPYDDTRYNIYNAELEKCSSQEGLAELDQSDENGYCIYKETERMNKKIVEMQICIDTLPPGATSDTHGGGSWCTAMSDFMAKPKAFVMEDVTYEKDLLPINCDALPVQIFSSDHGAFMYMRFRQFRRTLHALITTCMFQAKDDSAKREALLTNAKKLRQNMLTKNRNNHLLSEILSQCMFELSNVITPFEPGAPAPGAAASGVDDNYFDVGQANY
eukprot:gnl/TRDRNA2_/TRDRNA2_126954_c0_seq1.p1 gnl/TRDRNA2_/TRDRNA2_126954_c0~~gnl/TRDRNA2_/TRDRNA2_126954_c0_seq1.p1  ORF type:complete len:449 (+),score=73.40 gnl/TRDRNA2_/TRDRNA2_126954_c0_seq1:47-1393(+)